MHRELEEAGRFREALAAIEHAGGTMPYRDPVADELATERGRLLWRNARFDEAERVLEVAYADRCVRLGADHPDSLETLERLAANAHYQLRDECAVERFVAVIDRLDATLGSKHLRTGIAKRNYAACLRDHGQPQSAWVMLAEATRTIARHCKRDSPEAVATLKVEALLRVCSSDGDVAETVRLCLDVADLASSVHGAAHALTASALLTLASAQLEVGRLDVAIAVAKRAADVFEKSYGPHPLLGLALDREASGLAARAEIDAALATMRTADRIYQMAYPTLVLPAWGHIMNAMLEADRVADVLAETAALLQRPLSQECRDVVTGFRDVALGR